MTVAGFEKFMVDLCGSPFASSVGEINSALQKLDAEADFNPDAERLLKILEIVSNKSVPVSERREEMRHLTNLRGKVSVRVEGWTGWR